MVRYLIPLVINFIFSIYTLKIQAQGNPDITSRQSELKKIKNEIYSLEKEILVKTKKEKESYSLLLKYDKQNFLLNKIINRFRVEENQIENEILTAERKIDILSKEILRLQTNYAKYVNAIYRKGKQSDLAAIFNSESISQALRRIFYFKKFSERREKDLIAFEVNKAELQSAKELLTKKKAEKLALVEKKEEEETILKKKSSEKREILNVIRKDKTELRKELDVKKKAELTIKNIITKLVEQKVKRDKEIKEKLRLKEELLAEKNKNKSVTGEKNNSVDKLLPEDESLPKNISSFEQLKGKLNWPVHSGKIIRKFGENKNLILNTITLNYGVDIKVTSDSKVKSVSNGLISAIEWIPGYGSIIIISHNEDFRTVYSHLNEIYVREGEQVNAGQTIASVGESIEGNVLHFEIWNSRTHQNPEIWLSKK